MTQRFVLVGCGRIARQHAAAFERLRDECELVAVCDRDEARAREIAPAGVGVFTDLNEMLRDVQADCALIGTPSGLHPEHVEAVARAGLHAVTEKPMAVSLADADRMIAACQAAGRKLFVIKQLRRLPTMQALKAAVDAGQFGRIFVAQTNVFWTRPQSYYDEAPWRGSRKMDGGVLHNQASHYIDLLLWLLGPVASLTAEAGTLGRTMESEDTACSVLRFAGGTIATVNATILTYPTNLEGTFTLLGERGTVKLGGRGINEIVKWEFEDDVPVPGQARFSELGEGHAAYLREVVECLEGTQTATALDGAEGRRSLEVIDAILQSARESRTIQL